MPSQPSPAQPSWPFNALTYIHTYIPYSKQTNKPDLSLITCDATPYHAMTSLSPHQPPNPPPHPSPQIPPPIHSLNLRTSLHTCMHACVHTVHPHTYIHRPSPIAPSNHHSARYTTRHAEFPPLGRDEGHDWVGWGEACRGRGTYAHGGRGVRRWAEGWVYCVYGWMDCRWRDRHTYIHGLNIYIDLAWSIV